MHGFDSVTLFSGAVGALTLVLALVVHLKTREAERTRRNRLTHVRRFDAIVTSSPLDDPAGTARERGHESIAARFTLIRRAGIPLVFIVGGFVAAFPWLGRVPATALSLIVALAAVISGIAAKPLLENVFAGLALSFSQAIRVGDTVRVDEHYGTVEDMSLTHTTVKVWDWRRYLVPNAKMMTKEFLNYSLIDRYQWAYVEFWVEPEADLEVVKKLAEEAPLNSDSFADYEPPRFWVMEMSKDGVRCWVAAWADTPSAAWQLTHDIRTKLLLGLKRANIRTHCHMLGGSLGHGESRAAFAGDKA